MNTREFLKCYAWVYCLVVAFFLGTGALVRHSVEAAASLQPIGVRPVFVIDAGHGGEDGGTTGLAGTGESQVNLAIARRLNALLRLMGYDTIMTRTEDVSLHTGGDTIRSRKQSDLRRRVEIANGQPSCLFISIHQNHFPDSRYSGPQVFHTDGSENLARELQSALNRVLAPTSRRTAKLSTGVYVMQHLDHPGILVECGFLSNSDEEQKLRSADHQKQLAAVIAAVVAGSQKTGA